MISYLKKIYKMSFRTIVGKIYKRLHDKLYYSIREYRVRIKSNMVNGSIFHDWESDIKLFLKTNDRDYYVDYLKKHEKSDDIIFKADKICNHIFNLLGSGDIYLGDSIEWNQDFKSGFTWKNNFHKRIKIVDINNNADVKVPWELSRFQHLPVLGQAYWITEDKKYKEEFVSEIEDWMKKNPVEMSVNWSCTMDVAIRACNWIVGIEYFRKSDINNQFWIEINKWLFMHGNFIFKNLEKEESNNNHYLSNLVGLIWLGLYFKKFDCRSNDAEKWLAYGLCELENEMKKQVYEDGCNFEASTAYHCFVTELLLYTDILCKHNRIYFSREYEKKLEKMCEVIMNITKPNGLIPLIGDMDSGRFIMFTGYGDTEMRDFRYLLGIAGEYFNRSDFIQYASNQMAALWMFNSVRELIPNELSLKSISYPHGGLHILRNDRVYLIIRCGKNGTQGKGGHSHNDQLSFELNLDGEDFIVDPGTYVYTSDYRMRNLFRSTSYHNTLQVNNFEQNDFDEKSLFSLQNQTKAEVIEFGENNFIGIHYGYLDKAGLKHVRKVSLKADRVVVEDLIIYDKKLENNPIEAKVPIIFDSKVCVKSESGFIVAENKKAKIYLITDDNFKLIDTYIAAEYGELVLTEKAIFSLKKEKSRLELVFVN